MKNKNLTMYVTIICLLFAFLIFIINYKLINKPHNNNNNNEDMVYLEKVTYNEFKDLIDAEKTFVLYVASAACPACQTFLPIFTGVLAENDLYVKYIDLTEFNTDDNIKLNEIVMVDSIPVVIFIKDGSETSILNRIEGVVPKSKIIDKLKDNDYIH